MATGFTFDEYQEQALKTADYPGKGGNMLYPALGLGGEAGEVLEKVKKGWRNDGIIGGAFLTAEKRDAIVKEIGDVLWYCAALAYEAKVSLGEVATTNIEKLAGRVERGTIKSEGDER